MDILKRHEVFEMEVLELLNSGKLLEPLVFGGGTMLRLCYELNRYSVDLDFWFIKEADTSKYFSAAKKTLSSKYELTDACDNFNTLLFELRSPNYPRLLKLEVRKKVKNCDWQERIAYSKFSDKQVLLRTHTLEQTLLNKIEAALERREIRDFFDMEFIIRKGINLPMIHPDKVEKMIKVIKTLGEKDYKVKLGSILDPAARRYYVKNGFSLLEEKLVSMKQGMGGERTT
ncbi:MAG: nucleotidyl transferase AbiEii/AbiGii toxin family protein [Candidatus Omnitrophica bacterium]|nr:nucleotidyl transferase AbiEii/AbiGii toxin family protein [Candidatus Omnitrophota bacterium]